MIVMVLSQINIFFFFVFFFDKLEFVYEITVITNLIKLCLTGLITT